MIRARLSSVELAIALDRGDLVGQILVLDRVADPGRVVPGAEVVQPGPIVDPGRDLQEQGEVLSAQGERAVGAAEVEAAVLAKLALAVLAGVAAALQLGLDHLHPRRPAIGAALPQQRLACLDPIVRGQRRRRFAEARAELPDRARGRIADRGHRLHGGQDLGRQLVGMDRDQDRGVQLARQGHAGGPRRWREMMGLVEDDPVRPAGLGAQLREPGQQPLEESSAGRPGRRPAC